MVNRGLNNKISNIIGTKVPQWLIQQLDTRASRNSDDIRNNENLLYLANKSAWVRLVSSVDIDQKRDLKYFSSLAGIPLSTPQSLAKNFILFGGTSAYTENNSYNLRSGVSFSDPSKTVGGAYGMLGKEEIQKYGYRPMPGIMNATIETQGRLGSIRGAIINFKCWDKAQLDIIDALYFKLGFTMILEWGHTYFYTSDQQNSLKRTEDYSIIDPFKINVGVQAPFGFGGIFARFPTKEEMLAKISQANIDTEGNYDAMLGIVTNFNFVYNTDGGYDCTLRLMSLGMLGDSIKINNPATLPNLLKEEIVLLDKTLKFLSQNQLNGDTNLEESDPKEQTILRILNRRINNVDKEPENAQKSAIIDRAGILNSENREVKYQSQNLPNTQLIDPKSIGNYDFIYPVDGGYRFYSKDFKVQIDPQAESSFIQNISLDINKLREKVNLNFGNYLTNRTKDQPLFNSIEKYLYYIENSRNITTSLDSYESKYLLYRSGINQKIYYLKISVPRFKIFSEKDLSSLDAAARIDPITSFFAGLISRYTSITNTTPTRALVLKAEIEIIKNVTLKLLEKLLGVSTAGNDFPNVDLNFQGDQLDLRIIENNTDEYLNKIDPAAIKLLPSTNQGLSYSLKFSGNYPYPVLEKEKAFTNDGSQVVLTESTTDIPFIIETNDFSLVKSAAPVNDPNILLGDYLKLQQDIQLENQNQLEAQRKEEERKEQEALINQIEQSFPFQSALELTLKTIQVHALNRAIYEIPEKPDGNIGNKVFVLKMTEKNEKEFLESIFSNGIFTNIIQDLINKPDSIQLPEGKDLSSEGINSDLRFKLYAKYGFLSSLLGNKTSIEQLENAQVDYKKLLTAFVIPYRIEQELTAGIKTNHPVYIPLGLVLMLLNHICTIYDSRKGTNFQTPLVYIDYNPELNFFLTNAQQLSTDPFKVLIPFEGTNKDYQQLFYDEVLNASRDGIKAYKDPNQKVSLFKPEEEDAISYAIQEYCPIKFDKKENSVYRGKLMNILLSIDYLTDQVKQYSRKDGTNNVYLKPFLEQILFDINKALGNFNAFRVSYNDSSNTFQIVDDQVVPTLGSEEMAEANKNQNIITNRTEIPLIGKTSIAKSIDTRTEIGSQLGSLLAISANPNMKDKSTLSINADPVGYLNTAFSDRYITNRLAIGSEVKENDVTSKIIEAIKFNSTITDFYSSVSPSDADVSQVTSYYMERMSRVKNAQTASLAAAMVPIGINFTTDGIGGLNMGQAFTVSNELLPYSYTMQFRPGYIDNYNNYVGFVIVGLNHTIESNQWNTSVKTNMIALKDKTSFTADKVKAIPKSDRVFRETSSNTVSPTISNIIKGKPWSAAFISYVMKKAEVDFPFNASHIRYLNALRGDSNFDLLDPSKTKVVIGDIVVYNRNGNNQTYSSNPYSGDSHGDIIVSSNTQLAEGIGGNVSDSVSKTSYTLNNSLITNKNVFVIVRPKIKINEIVNAAKYEYNLWSSNKWKDNIAEALPTLIEYYKIVNITLS